MHIIIGALVVVGSFVVAMQYISMDFSGFLNIYSAILLSGVPLGLMILTYPFSTLRSALSGLAMALFHRPERSRELLTRKLLAFARETRRERGLAADRILQGVPEPVFQRLGRQVLQETNPEEIELDASIYGRRVIEPYQQAEKVLSSLGDFAPAMGMIGTVIGLIQLLANMRDFEKLGPGMAIALLTTFYGLILAHLFYLPLARMVATRGSQRSENINMVIEAMLKLARRRPLHEVQEVLGGTSSSTAAQAPDTRADQSRA
ncbi:MAG: MotA/TolQ/ExbB proton channel family protein [Proteobacteria bacterium]|nr:MotA/TolQ/ExbB proton channel family protein [Pseudomonadota bacterium]